MVDESGNVDRTEGHRRAAADPHSERRTASWRGVRGGLLLAATIALAGAILAGALLLLLYDVCGLR